MIVIADTSPVSYLILIDEIEILPRLYGRILLPIGVLEELTTDNSPEKVRIWLEKRPEWIEVNELQLDVALSLSTLLDKGESEAIQLAKNLNADLLLIDELVGRRIAVENGLNVIGTIGVLASASKKGLIDAEKVISKLADTNFYVSEDLLELLRNSRT